MNTSQFLMQPFRGAVHFRVLLAGAEFLTTTCRCDISRCRRLLPTMTVYRTIFKTAARKAAHSVLCPTCRV